MTAKSLENSTLIKTLLLIHCFLACFRAEGKNQTVTLEISPYPYANVIEAKSLTFTCLYRGNGSVILMSWKNNGTTNGTIDTIHCKQFGTSVSRNLLSYNCTSDSQISWTILRVTEQQHGTLWSCVMLVDGRYLESSSTKVFVLVPVESVKFVSPVGSLAVVDEDSLSDFTCITSEERPRSIILWYVDNGTIPLSGELMLPVDNNTRAPTISLLRHNFTREDNGKIIFCTANNIQLADENTRLSDVKELFVQYPQDGPPQIHGYSNGSYYSIIESSPQNFVCSVSGGNPLPKLSWNCNNGTTYDGISNSTTVTKFVSWTATKNEHYNCTCVSNHSLSGVISSYIFVSVLYPPNRPKFYINGLKVDSIQVIKGTQVFVRCESQGEPPPSYTWNGTHLSQPVSTQQLLLPVTDVGMTGVYTCVATNEMRPTSGLSQITSQSAQINLTVLYPPNRPKLKYSGQDVFEILQVILGDNVLLHCTSDGNPIPVCVWTGQNSSLLEIIDIQPASKGNYTCKANNNMVPSAGQSELGSNSEQISIDVLYGPSSPKFLYHHGIQSLELNDTETLKVREGSKEVTISCSGSAANPAPTYTWSGQTTSENGTLKLFNISRYDSGNYLCRVKNNLTRTVGKGKIEYFNRSLEINVLYLPVIEEMTDITLLEGNTLNISCTAISNPAATYRWTTANQTMNLSNDAILNLHDIHRSDSGTYTCTAETIIEPTGEVTSTAIASNQITISVLYKATISSFEAESFPEKSNVTIAEYDNITLTCIVESKPLSKIHIMHRNKQLKKVDSADRTSYNLNRAKCTDSGLYSCAAQNTFNAEASTKELQLFVRCSPRPGISTTANITANLNGRAEFSVNILAYPSPTEYIWYIYTTGPFDWITLKNSTKYIMLTDEGWYNLTVNNVVMEDFREYILEVDNGEGQPYEHHFLLQAEEEIVNKSPGGSSQTSAIIGGVAGVLIIILIATAIGKFCHSRTRPGSKKENQHDLVVLRQKIKTKSVSTQNLSELKGFKPDSQINSAFIEVAKVEPERELDQSCQPTKDKIQVKKLWDYLNRPDFHEKLEREYQALHSGLLYSCSEANLTENGKKNRYRDMIAYDHSRVVLERKILMESTYINANFIDGYKCEKKFIASQGPTDAMVNDFWEMILQQKTSTIVMLTNLIESRAHKCMQYWPEVEETRLFSDISVSAIKSTIYPDYVVREFDISKENESPRRITQFHFTAWPDKAIPGSAWHLVNFWRKASMLNWKSTGPVVVHCSAGVGRTGTYIALDNLYTQAKTEGYIEPFEIVTKMRDQRVNMVQTKEQYVFLHEALAEALFLGQKPLKPSDFAATFTGLLEEDKETGITGLEDQFKWIKDSTSLNEQPYGNVSPIRESEEYRPKRFLADNTDAMNVCYVQNYTEKDIFLVITSPGLCSVEEIRMVILRHNIRTMINLGNALDLKVTDSDTESKKNYLKPVVTKQGTHYDEKTYSLSQGDINKSIKEFVFHSWKEDTVVPSDTKSVIALLNAVQSWQPFVYEAQPILIYCK